MMISQEIIGRLMAWEIVAITESTSVVAIIVSGTRIMAELIAGVYTTATAFIVEVSADAMWVGLDIVAVALIVVG